MRERRWRSPVGAHQGIDEEALEPGSGRPIAVIAGGHGFQVGRIFAGNNLSAGVNAGFERIQARNGLPLSGAGTGGELRIATIRFDLEQRGHIYFPTTE
jgi:hypothetical protein